jgi:hypothetical protein
VRDCKCDNLIIRQFDNEIARRKEFARVHLYVLFSVRVLP